MEAELPWIASAQTPNRDGLTGRVASCEELKYVAWRTRQYSCLLSRSNEVPPELPVHVQREGLIAQGDQVLMPFLSQRGSAHTLVQTACQCSQRRACCGHGRTSRRFSLTT